MTTPLQDISSIAPLAADGKNKKPVDPIVADYEEGKRLLANHNYGQAAVSLHNALLGYEEKGDETGIANASNQLGHVCLARKEFEQAEKHYQRAWEICEKLQDPMSQIALQKQFIAVYCGLKDYTQAIAVCLDLLDRYHMNNDPRGTVRVMEEMATIYLAAGEKAKAADAYRTVASIHQNFQHRTTAEGYLKKARDLEEAA
jgi:tetratricopeptide (TPR) repeat protein